MRIYEKTEGYKIFILVTWSKFHKMEKSQVHIKFIANSLQFRCDKHLKFKDKKKELEKTNKQKKPRSNPHSIFSTELS